MEQPAAPDRPLQNMPAAVPQHSRPIRREPPPLTGLDRRSERRMSRGQVEIEGRLDLHGTGIEDSRWRLLQFVTGERRRGARVVLVITGKGDSPFASHTLHGISHFHAPERQGRLRRLVPEWLHEPEFRAHVAGFQPAHPRHGGGGAFYVTLRRADRG
jgi:DNA-nicking Smr family endonuclease